MVSTVAVLFALAADGGPGDLELDGPERWDATQAVRCAHEAGGTLTLPGCWLVKAKIWPVGSRPMIQAGAQKGDRTPQVFVTLRSQQDGGVVLARSRALKPLSGAFGVLDDVTIDTAPYQLTARRRAFGVRVTTHQAGSGFTSETISLMLLLVEGTSVVPVLEEDVSYVGEPIREGQSSSQTSTIQVLRSQTGGYFDLQLTTIETVESEPPRRTKRVFRWDGTRYGGS